jgi:hypothetical protein
MQTKAGSKKWWRGGWLSNGKECGKWWQGGGWARAKKVVSCGKAEATSTKPR